MWYVSVLFLLLGVAVMVVSLVEGPRLTSMWSALKTHHPRTSEIYLSPVGTLSPLDRFDVIYYINLDHRTDRRQEIEAELDRMHVPRDKLVRIPGVVPVERKGAIGCTMAHINALEHFHAHPAYQTCAVFEDDFQFMVAVDELDRQLGHFWQELAPSAWDVLMLAGRLSTQNDEVRSSCWRVDKVDTTSGYALTRGMVDPLLANYREGLAKLRRKYNLQKYALDEYWKRIQPDHRWYALKPLVGTQRESYSDINNHVKEVKSFVRTRPVTEVRRAPKGTEEPPTANVV